MLKNTFLMLFLLLMFLFGCTSSTNPIKGNINGTLILEGLKDHSGINVMLFKADVVNEAIKDVQERYPQLAFTVSDELVFDHRTFQSLASVLTTNTGSFAFDKLHYGKYIIAFFKEEWGYKYLFEIVLNSDYYSINAHYDIEDLSLHPVVSLPASVTDDYTFARGHTYIVEQDVLFLEGSNLFVEPKSIILLDPGKKITILGSSVFPDGEEYIIVTSSSAVYNEPPSEIQNGDGLVFLNQTGTIKNLCMSYLNTALYVRSSNTRIQNVMIRNSNFGITNFQVSNVSISGCVFIENNNVNGAAIYNNLVDGFHADHCMFSNNYLSVINEVTIEALIENCFFGGGNVEFRNIYDSETIFRYNTLENTATAIENTGRSNLHLFSNSIKANICVKTYHTLNWYNSINHGWTSATNNNFFATELCVESKARYYSTSTAYPLDFKQNYWGTTNINTIAELIVDYHELGEHDTEWVWSEVLFQPYKSTEVVNAGIQ